MGFPVKNIIAVNFSIFPYIKVMFDICSMYLKTNKYLGFEVY